jgi:aspartate carbamoyltransferase catalytic subunit
LVPIINAGDRQPDDCPPSPFAGQHPTQAFLDVFTIQERLGGIDGVSIAMVGDLINGRTVRSLSYLLGKFKGVTIYFVSPKHAQMRQDVKDYLDRHNIRWCEVTDLREVAGLVDVVYQTRTQKECGTTIDRNDHSMGYFIVDCEILRLMKKDAIVMHPLPRVDEIGPEVDADPRAVYLNEQVKAGLYTRMALLKMILAPTA